jgi:RNA polymerase sigma-70 factor (ECF subfamily)
MEELRNRSPADQELAAPDRGTVDAKLVARYRDGDTEAFAALYRHHVHAIYAFAFAKLGTATAAEEATQSIFVRALHSLGQYDERGRFQGWLFVIAARVCADARRAAVKAALPLEAAADHASADASPEDSAVASDAIEQLRRARRECLGARDRELYDLVVQGLTHREIAEALGKRAGAVRQAHVRLLDRLRACLGPLTSLPGGRHGAT